MASRANHPRGHPSRKVRNRTMKIYQLSSVRLAAVAMLLLCSAARADILITFSDNGTLTTATITGSVDLGPLGTPTAPNAFQPTRQLSPINGWFTNATSQVKRYDSTSFSSASGTGYGTGGSAVTTGVGSSISGDTFGFAVSTGQLAIDSRYISNSPLNGSMTLVGTIASLGINPFTQYAFSRSTGGGTGVSQTITLQTVSVVPEPSAFALMGLGVAGLALWRRRKPASKQA